MPSGGERMFVVVTRSRSEIEAVLTLKAAGLTDRAASEATGVPIGTIRLWRRRGLPAAHDPSRARCGECGAEPHVWTELPTAAYSYLLGVYLGDGHLRRWGSGWTLRVTLDTAYTEIIRECSQAVVAVSGIEPKLRPDSTGKNCVNLDSSWRSWPCLLPQHGPGRKHHRPIVLSEWQQAIVDAAPGQFLRGLIHTDGWRGTNRVHAKGREYEYPRYQFSNRSDDIRALFTAACDQLGVDWRPWTRFHISVARAESVAILDRFVGPKR
jgi:hypothetical protein